VSFRDRLLATLRAIAPVFDEPGVMVIGSEVPNLLEESAAASLVVSQDVDVGVTLAAHASVKRLLPELVAFRPHDEEPSVLIPTDSELIEVNFVGIDPDGEIGDAFVFEDAELPLMVFGALSLLREREPVTAGGIRVPVPRPAGLVLEKLLSDRAGEKGERDLLVALGLLVVSEPSDLSELADQYADLEPELRHQVRSNLTLLSLLEPHPAMPDPRPERARIARLLHVLESREPGET
jgi:hypothetical protein